MRRVVLTGLGIWSSIGSDQSEVEQSLRLGESGIGTDYRRIEYGYQSPLTGIVPSPDLSQEGLRRSQRMCMSEAGRYAYMAVKQAFLQAPFRDRSRLGLIVSNDSTAGELADVEQLMSLHHDSRRLGSGAVFRSLNSTVSMSLASIFGIGGLSLTVSAACAGGGHAIGLALSLIRSGQLDACVVVGAQEVGLHAYTSFDALGVFSQRIREPSKASRPFDVARDGLVPSGGAACVILESAEYAAMGNRKPLAEICGYGFSTSPDIVSPSADSICKAMIGALHDASVDASELSAIMAHATSTQDGDRAEAEALLSLDARKAYILSTKCLTGHECWMSGVSQVVYALIQMNGGFVSPHVNLEQPEPIASQLNIPRVLQQAELKYVLCNAFGFGGTNSSIVLSQ